MKREIMPEQLVHYEGCGCFKVYRGWLGRRLCECLLLPVRLKSLPQGCCLSSEIQWLGAIERGAVCVCRDVVCESPLGELIPHDAVGNYSLR